MSANDQRLAAWIGKTLQLSDVRPGPVLGGGNSNVTQRVDHRDGSVIVRRPPDSAISTSAANGVRREYAMLCAIADEVPVPKPLAHCDDTDVIGQPFIVVEHIDGIAISTELPGDYSADTETLNRLGEQMIDGIAAAHRLDWQILPLRRPSGEPADYVPRQIERWLSVRRRDSVRDLPLIAALAAWLEANLPAHRAGSVMHGDFHLDNTLFATEQPELRAIIDWELATLGDPMSDLGLMLAFWGERDVESPGFAFVQAVTRGADSLVSRETLATRWATATGLNADALDYYRVFALWRLASIVEGAFVLYRGGRVDSSYARNLEHDVPNLLEEAATIAGLR